MARVFDQIDEPLAEWIRQQHLFFVATAPRADDGLVNCSPKGLDTFAILDPHTVAYLDLTGSGVETMAHLKENGRIVIMFCALEGAPRIVRLHGTGVAVEAHDTGFAALAASFPQLPGVRSVIRIDVARVSDSCGFGVPLYEYEGERDALVLSSEKKGPAGVRDYQLKNNARSLDGLPGVAVSADEEARA